MNEATLSDDPKARKALIGEPTGRLAACEAEPGAERQALRSIEQRIAQPLLQIAVLPRARLERRSEHLERDLVRLGLELEELQSAQAETLASAPTPRPRPARRPLRDHLPRATGTVAAGKTECPGCGDLLESLGKNVSEILEYPPASLKLIRPVRPKLGCGCCESIMQAPAIGRPIDRDLAVPGLLTQALVSKFADHLPLHRQSAIDAREGVKLPRSTLAECAE